MDDLLSNYRYCQEPLVTILGLLSFCVLRLDKPKMKSRRAESNRFVAQYDLVWSPLLKTKSRLRTEKTVRNVSW